MAKRTSSTPPAPAPRKRLSVAFLLADSFTLSAFANFVDVLRLAADEADMSRPILCDWAVLSDTMTPVRSSCGVRVTPDTSLRRAGKFDYIVVVGGVMGDKPALSRAESAFLTARAEAGTPVVGLCTGVFLLHEAGLLDGYRCCVSWFHHQDFVNRFDSVQPVSDQIFVVDRDRLTCSGGHGSAHLAAFLVSRHVGQSAAIKSLNIMMIDEALRGDEAQPGQQTARTPRDDLVKRAILRMQQNIEVPLSIAALARQLGVGRRTLERRVLADLGQPPSKLYLDIRLDRALQKLRSTNDPVAEIGLATGFCDGTHLARVLKAERGFAPGEYRKAQASPQEDLPAVGILLNPRG
ncbi:MULTISPECIES: GlxA family transcriptional regulator [Mameliella]|uniref:GlxA family transcriptional regulator n=1 Tax=Mameliella TaxID=1434019 RepID=UPI000B534290|nr:MULTISPECIES: GlxA family transcriptional regulator [Mameliella]MCR9274831.1 GlxA family transcriptional regulator [Paracoccaceae bacterium]MBY6118254.1 GlxA family transcriptional regulator [Mameliella alba]OWV43462.1 AraC family transcriptional regulator [Mameliella alba]OWV58057.1 AraC family transcriptional regulator [Mameliella alba]OWV68599.1 AraC family transcriptional regulator [Mameliella alba]